VFEVADAAFASGSPFDEVAELASAFDGSSGLAGLAFSRYGNGFHTDRVQVVVDAGFAVAAVGGDGGRYVAYALGDTGDGRGQLWGVGGVALVEGV
jgi:hypothetical protein